MKKQNKETRFIIMLPDFYDFDEVWGRPRWAPQDNSNYYGKGYLGLVNYYGYAAMKSVNTLKGESVFDKLTLHSSKAQAERRLKATIKEVEESSHFHQFYNGLPIQKYLELIKSMKIYEVEIKTSYTIKEI